MANLADRHPSVAQVAEHFSHDHLPPHLQAVSRPFGELVDHLLDTLPDSAELTVALRKLLEGKDAAVRCAVALAKSPPGPRGAERVDRGRC